MSEPVDRFSLETMVMFALTKARLPGRRLTEDDRRILAAAVADHFKLCRWDVTANPTPVPRAPTYQEPDK